MKVPATVKKIFWTTVAADDPGEGRAGDERRVHEERDQRPEVGGHHVVRSPRPTA